jgi:formylglycine-generating enzyme required for sulfatase activity
VEDWYEQDSGRVLRGGSYLDAAWYLRAPYRLRGGSDLRNDFIGFRSAYLEPIQTD